MRKLLCALILVSLGLGSVPMGQAAEGDVIFEDGDLGEDWTTDADMFMAPGMDWHPSTNGNGDDTARYAGISDPAGQGNEVGYASHLLDGGTMSVYLTSPMINEAGLPVGSLSFDLTGSSEEGFDFLVAEVNAGGSWNQVFITSGSNYADGYGTVAVDVSSIVGADPFQVRFRFEVDPFCDSFDANPAFGCPAPGEVMGWYVDNVAVTEGVPQGPPSDEPIPVGVLINGTEQDALAVDLVEDRNVFYEFLLDEDGYPDHTADGPFKGAYIEVDAGGESFTVHLTSPRVGEWTGSLEVQDERLVAGSGAITVYAIDTTGTLQILEQFGLSVTADDDTPPAIGPLSGPSPVHLGANDVLRIAINEPLLRDVHYVTDAMTTALPLESPYALGTSLFQQGANGITFIARDRAGNVGALELDVIVDTEDPVLAVQTPESVYQGVPAEFTATVDEASLYKVVFVEGGEAQFARGEAGTEDHTFTVTFDETGQRNVVFQVVDRVGNMAQASRQIDVEQAITDAAVSLDVVSGKILAGEPVRFEVTASQVGVTEVPFQVDLDPARGDAAVLDVTLAAEDTRVIVHEQVYPPGPNVLSAVIRAPDGVVEQNLTDQNDTVEFQVYLGKVVHGDDEYYIRADARSVPLEAVSEDDEAHPLTLDQSGQTVYRFEADGTSLHWDPLQQVTVIEPQDDTTETPGFGLVAALALLGAAAFIARRRRP